MRLNALARWHENYRTSLAVVAPESMVKLFGSGVDPEKFAFATKVPYELSSIVRAITAVYVAAWLRVDCEFNMILPLGT